MRDLDLLNRWLVQQRQSALAHCHYMAMASDTDLLQLKALAFQAEFCDRVREAVKVLAKDPGQFIKEFIRDDQ